MDHSPELDTGITRDIYGMPAFVSIDAADVRRAADWCVAALGFIELFAMPPGPSPSLVHLRRWRYQDILIRKADADATVGPGIQLSFAAEHDELDALAASARRAGARHVEGPADTAWHTRDVTVTTPFGLRVTFTARRPEPERDAEFTARMEQWSREQLPG